MNRRTAAVLGVVAAGVAFALVAATAHAGSTGDALPPAAGAPAGGEQSIIGGRPAPEGTYPWMAHLTVSTAGGPLVCGGSLLSADVVITAAHCLDGATGVVVSLGRVTHHDGAKRTVVKHKVGPGPEKGDWAVMRLSSPYKAAAYPVLPADAGKDKSPHFTVMGWGALKEGGKPVDALRHVVVPLVPDTRCGPAARVEVCAGDLKKGGKDTCQGDSGGPLAVKSGSRWVLVGVTSWGKGCAKPNEPGHYAQLSALLGPVKAAVAEIGGIAPHSETDPE